MFWRFCPLYSKSFTISIFFLRELEYIILKREIKLYIVQLQKDSIAFNVEVVAENTFEGKMYFYPEKLTTQFIILFFFIA